MTINKTKLSEVKENLERRLEICLYLEQYRETSDDNIVFPNRFCDEYLSEIVSQIVPDGVEIQQIFDLPTLSQKLVLF